MPTRLTLSFYQRIAMLLVVVVAGLVAVLLSAPIPQDPAYHLFADQRARFGIPNFNDVVSNGGFAVVGLVGLLLVLGRRNTRLFVGRVDARPYRLFFAGVALVSIGSAYYHLAPDNETLLWDRLPMSIAFMAFASAIIADRVDARAGNGWLLWLLLLLGVTSLLYWDYTERLGRGDLRFYAFVQFYPLLMLPLLFWLFPRGRYVNGRYIVWVIAWYLLSKLFEHFDAELFVLLGQQVSGHTLKHLAAAIGAYHVYRMLATRLPMADGVR